MLFASATHITLGWAWHVAYRVRYHWSLRREGALAAAAVVALVGAVEVTRDRHPVMPDVVARDTTMAVDAATTVLTEKTPPAVEPTEGPPNPIPLQLPQTADAAPSPALDPAPTETAEASRPDPIGQAIADGKLYNDPAPATASIPEKTRHLAHKPRRTHD